MKLYELGVYHHNCWNTDSINMFTDIFSCEWGPRSIRALENGKKVSRGVWKIGSACDSAISDYLKFLKSRSGVLDAKLLSKNAMDALVGITWKSSGCSSYELVMKSGTSYYSNTYSKGSYEAYSVFSEQPNVMKRLIEEFEDIGEVKIFRVKDGGSPSPSINAIPGLTQKQRDAIAFAIASGYYSWPKVNNLEKLAKKSGRKRRTIQELIRKAEGKVMPWLLDYLYTS
ncbi:MAG: helix-turn-helix domain-containing protein [Candidatus Micrarchaeota archaeon]